MSRSRNPDGAKSKTIKMDRHISQARQPEDAYLLKLPADVCRSVISPYLSDKDVSSLSKSCFRLYGVHQAVLNKHALHKLLQAVVDNDRTTVKNILDAKPELLLAKPGNLVIESKKTWQRFYAENALPMAGKRKQLKIVKLLLSYIDKLEEADKAVVLAQWTAPDVSDPKEKARVDARNQNLQAVYRQFLQPLVDVIARESCPHGYKGKLSEETEKALGAFRNTILPEDAVRLDDYYDVEQLLIAGYQTYTANFDAFQTWDQRYAFCIRVLGFIQSMVTPELAQLFCEGLLYVVDSDQKISARAENLLLENGVPFYRASRDSLEGLGGKFVVDDWACDGGAPIPRRWWPHERFVKVCRAKESALGEFMRQLRDSMQHRAAPVKSLSMCVIL